MNLNAEQTNTTVRASETLGERSVGYFTFYLTDEFGNKLTDESGNKLIVYAKSGAIMLRAEPTDTKVRANA